MRRHCLKKFLRFCLFFFQVSFQILIGMFQWPNSHHYMNTVTPKELCISLSIHCSCCSDVVFLPAAVVMKQEHTARFRNTYTIKSIQQIDSLLAAPQACLHKHYHSFSKLSSRWNMNYWFQFFSLSGPLLLPWPCKRTSRVLGGSQHMLRSQVQSTAKHTYCLLFTVCCSFEQSCPGLASLLLNIK